jgi:hypothetical protein
MRRTHPAMPLRELLPAFWLLRTFWRTWGASEATATVACATLNRGAGGRKGGFARKTLGKKPEF